MAAPATQSLKCVVTGDGAVGKVSLAAPATAAQPANRADMSPHLVHDQRLPGRVHPHRVRPPLAAPRVS